MTYIFYLIVLFVLVWGPYLNVGIGFFADTQVATSFAIAVTSGFSGWKNTTSEIKQPILAIALLALYVTFLSIGYDQFIYVPVLRVLRAAIMLYGCWCLVDRIYKHWGEEGDRLLITALYVGVVAHGVLMFLQFVNPTLREMITRWTFASEGVDVNLRTRMPGLATGGGAQLSVFMSIGFLLFPYCYVVARGWTNKLFLAFGFAITAIAVVLSGRSGVYSALFLFPLMIALVGRFQYQAGGIVKYIMQFLSIGGIIFVASIAIYLLDNALRNTAAGEDYSDYAFQRNLDMLLNPDEGFVRNTTVEELWNYHIMIPDDLRTLLFGDLINMDHSQGAGGVVTRKVDSDIGYVRLLFGYGLFGSFFHYGIYIYMIAKLWGIRRRNFLVSEIAIFIFSVMLIFNAKEVFVFTRTGWPICSLLYCAAICSATARKSQNKQLSGSSSIRKLIPRMQFRESPSLFRQ
jgi:hypothetical protein